MGDNQLLCPMKFGDAIHPEAIDWDCERERCAWWSKGGERCGLLTLSMSLWAIVDILKDKHNTQVKS